MRPPTSSSRAAGPSRAGRSETAAAVSAGPRVKALVGAAITPLVTGYAMVAALFALITATAAQAEFSTAGVLLAAGPGWLATYQVPVDIAGQTVSVLPGSAAVGVFLLVARSAAGAAGRLGCREPGGAVPIVATMAGAHGLFGLAVSALLGGSDIGVDPIRALLVPMLVAGLAALAGLAGPCGLIGAASRYLDPLARHGLRAGMLGLAALFGVGAAVFAGATIAAAPTVGELFDGHAPGFGSGLGMLLLCLLYLPNAVTGGLAFAVGPGFSLGEVSIGAFHFHGGPVPGVPLLAGLPEQQASWWPLLMLPAALAGVLVGWSVRRAATDPRTRLRIVVVAGALIGFGCVVLGTLAGGRLGSGVADPVSFPVGLFSLAAFGWIVVPGALTAWFAGPHERRERARRAGPADPDAGREGSASAEREDVADPDGAEDPDDVADPDRAADPDGEGDPDETEGADDVEGPEASEAPDGATEPSAAAEPDTAAAPDAAEPDTAEPSAAGEPDAAEPDAAEPSAAAEPDTAEPDDTVATAGATSGPDDPDTPDAATRAEADDAGTGEPPGR